MHGDLASAHGHLRKHPRRRSGVTEHGQATGRHHQVTYNGMHLCTFAQDHAAGETNGQGVKDVGTWTVITTGSAGSPAVLVVHVRRRGHAGAGRLLRSGGSSEGGYKY